MTQVLRVRLLLGDQGRPKILDYSGSYRDEFRRALTRRAGADGIHEVELSDGQVARVRRRAAVDVRRALGLAE